MDASFLPDKCARWGKIKALQGGLQGLGADRGSYLLPQVVGETGGMRGREPPVIHRVETLDYSVARWIQLSNRAVSLAIPWNVPSALRLHRFLEHDRCHRESRSSRRGNTTLGSEPWRSGDNSCHPWFSGWPPDW